MPWESSVRPDAQPASGNAPAKQRNRPVRLRGWIQSAFCRLGYPFSLIRPRRDKKVASSAAKNSISAGNSGWRTTGLRRMSRIRAGKNSISARNSGRRAEPSPVPRQPGWNGHPRIPAAMRCAISAGAAPAGMKRSSGRHLHPARRPDRTGQPRNSLWKISEKKCKWKLFFLPLQHFSQWPVG